MADDTHRSLPPPNRRRDKIQLSCGPCRARKLRCDRGQPCGACSRRGIVNSCIYARTSSSSPQAVPPRQSSSLHDRISELESLVVTLIDGKSAPDLPVSGPPSFAHDVTRQERSQDGPNPSSADPGTLELRESRTNYVQSAHWESVLNKIKGLKDDLITDSKIPMGSHLFYGPNRHATRDEILAAIPARPIVDRLMARQFESYVITGYIIHRKKFLREYEAFWQDSSAADMAWVALLFSMLHIAAQLQTFTIDSSDSKAETLKAEYLAMKDDFREKAVQSLMQARYTKAGGPHILETLMMILTGDFILSKDSATDGGLLSNMILHLAMRMGYHRDPDHFPSLSPFNGEMRRRIWATIVQLDLVISLEMGLPRSATVAHTDARPPRNLLDCDFDESTVELPDSRPETEWTPVLPLIARGRLAVALGMICDVNSDVNLPSYNDLKHIGSLLEDVHDRNIPPALSWSNGSYAITDSPNHVLQRVSMETTYHKSRILLYRRALSGKLPEWGEEALRKCLDSALQILSLQEMLHDESQPSGRLCQFRWKVINIFTQDVLLATSVLCLYLHDDVAKHEPHDQIRQRLASSQKIWLEMCPVLAEAGKVSKALGIVLGNTEACANECSMPLFYDNLPGFDAMPPGETNDFGLPSGYYSTLAFFDGVLGVWAG